MIKFKSNLLNRVKWSNDYKKRYNQLKYYENNHKKYDIDITDLINIRNEKRLCYKKFRR